MGAWLAMVRARCVVAGCACEVCINGEEVCGGRRGLR